MEERLPIWTIAANILNKQSRIAAMVFPPACGLEEGLTTPPCSNYLLTKHSQTKPRIWSNNSIRPKQRRTGLRFGSLKVRSRHRAGSLTAAARELVRYKLDLVHVQEIRWVRRGTVRAVDCNFFCGKGHEIHQLYLSIERAIKQTVVIIGHITFVRYVQHLSNILLSRLTLYAEEIAGNHQCGFRSNI